MSAVIDRNPPLGEWVVKDPPHSIQAEQAVLGGLMLDPNAWDQVSDQLSESDFYRRDHRVIFRAIASLANEGKPYDAVILGDWFVSNTDQVSGELPTYLVELANATPSAANIQAYATIVHDQSVKRQLIGAGTFITESALAPSAPACEDLLEAAEQKLFHVSAVAGANRRELMTMSKAAKAAFRTLNERYQHRGELIGIGTGFEEFDALTSGLQPADLIIVAARPSMGKTAFAMNIAEHAAFRCDTSTLIFSMEMSDSQLAFRIMSSLARVNHQHLRTGEVEDEEWPRITHAITSMSGNSHLFFDDTPSLSPVELRSRARRIYREHKIGLIIVDYLQLMQVPGSRENRATEIAEISRGLKALAKELNVPVVALSQLNRSLEQRSDKRPMMSDLRESGAIEQDADLIAFIYRDEYYNSDSESKGQAEIIIGKQRNGPTGKIKLAFRGEYSRFESILSSSFPSGLQ